MAKSKRKSSFRGRVNKDAQRQKAAGASYGYLRLPKGVKVYSPTPGAREKFDIIPYEVTTEKHPDLSDGFPEKGDLWYKRPFKVHRGIGADNDTVVCLTTFGKKCPICEYKKQRAKEGADSDELKGYNWSLRNLYLVVPIGHKKLDEEIHIFDFSQFLFQNLLNDELEENEDYEVFPDLEEGLTLKVRWEEKSFAKNKYADASRIDFLERDEPYSEDFLEEAPDLDSILIELSYKEMEAKFFETEEDSDDDEKKPFKDDEDEDEKPTRKRKTKKEPKEEKANDLTWDELSDMDITELCDVIDNLELDADADDVDDAKELCLVIAKELDIEVPKKKPTRKVKEEEKPKRKTTKKEGKEKCPSGYKFGVDTDDYDECDDCPLWDACIDKKEEG